MYSYDAVFYDTAARVYQVVDKEMFYCMSFVAYLLLCANCIVIA